MPFFAAGISSVMHPHNPFAPTMHFNYRYSPGNLSGHTALHADRRDGSAGTLKRKTTALVCKSQPVDAMGLQPAATG